MSRCGTKSFAFSWRFEVASHQIKLGGQVLWSIVVISWVIFKCLWRQIIWTIFILIYIIFIISYNNYIKLVKHDHFSINTGWRKEYEFKFISRATRPYSRNNMEISCYDLEGCSKLDLKHWSKYILSQQLQLLYFKISMIIWQKIDKRLITLSLMVL